MAQGHNWHWKKGKLTGSCGISNNNQVSGHQSQLFQGCSLCGLHVPSYYVRSAIAAGTLVSRIGPRIIGWKMWLWLLWTHWWVQMVPNPTICKIWPWLLWVHWWAGLVPRPVFCEAQLPLLQAHWYVRLFHSMVVRSMAMTTVDALVSQQNWPWLAARFWHMPACFFHWFFCYFSDFSFIDFIIYFLWYSLCLFCSSFSRLWRSELRFLIWEFFSFLIVVFCTIPLCTDLAMFY